MVRMGLEGVEVAAKITGTAAKEIAVFLMAALKNRESSLKLSGKARLTAMLKSGKALEIFSVKESDLEKFYEGAKQYGIVYCVLRNSKNSPDGLCDIMVKAEDAPKINRLVERFKFATVDKAKIESEIVKGKDEKKPDAPEKDDIEKLLDELMPPDEGKAVPEAKKTAAKETSEPAKAGDTDFFKGGAIKSHPSEPTSVSRSKGTKGTSSKPSVKGELREIRAARKEKDAEKTAHERATPDKPKESPGAVHKQPTKGRSRKSKKSKERA